jgi:nucleotide-binding universal stress UspA family protein
MYHRILVPLDGSATAERGLREAIALASDQKQKPRLVLLHVVGDFTMLAEMSAAASYQGMLDGVRRYGQDVLAKAKAAAAGASIEADSTLRELTQGRIADAIVDEARSASCDLIVMGTHGRHGLSRVAMGSDAEQVVRTSPVPVLLVRQEEAQS